MEVMWSFFYNGSLILFSISRGMNVVSIISSDPIIIVGG